MKATTNPLSNKITTFTATTIRSNVRKIILNTLEELYDYTNLEGCKHIIGYDMWDEPSGNKKIYIDYLKSLNDNFDSEIIVMPVEKQGLGRTVTSATNIIKTPYIFCLEHDWKFLRKIDFNKFLDVMDNHNEINYLRFWSKGKIIPRHNYDSRLIEDTEIKDIPLIKVWCYSGNPHIVRTDFIREKSDIINSFNCHKPSKNYEEPLTIAYRKDAREMGHDNAHKKWGIYIAGKLGDNPYLEP